MITLAAVIATALFMGYPIHRLTVQRNEAQVALGESRSQLKAANDTADSALEVLGLVMRGTPVHPGSEGAKVLPFGGRG